MLHIKLNPFYDCIFSWCGEEILEGDGWFEVYHINNDNNRFTANNFCNKCLQNIICKSKIILKNARK
jgi:hypothetical protein